MKEKTEKEYRNKIIKARVTDTEELLVKQKAKYYGYKNLSKYLVDSAIYEKVTYVDTKNQDLILKAYDENNEELRKFLKQIRNICKYATMIDSMTVQNIKSIMFTIIRNQKKILNLIDEKLDLEVWKEINHIKNLQEEK